MADRSHLCFSMATLTMLVLDEKNVRCSSHVPSTSLSLKKQMSMNRVKLPYLAHLVPVAIFSSPDLSEKWRITLRDKENDRFCCPFSATKITGIFISFGVI